MSHNFPPELIQKTFDSLPDDIKSVLAAPEATQRLQHIGRSHDLRMDKIGLLIENTTLVALGLVKTKDFIRRLQSQLAVSREQAEAITADVDAQFFNAMRESLRKVQYRSTSEQRFGERDDRDLSFENDGYGAEPMRESLINDIEADANGSLDLSDMSGSDYDPGAFNKASEYGNEAKRIGPNKLDTFEEETTFGEAAAYTKVGQEQKMNAMVNEPGIRAISPAFESDYDPSAASAAAVSAVSKKSSEVVPGFEKQAASETKKNIDRDPVIVTNFKERLREQIDKNKDEVNIDPYKESI